MTSVNEICRRIPRAPFFSLLYIGKDAGRAKRLRATLEDLGVLRGFWQAGSVAEAAALDPEALYVGKFAGCLLLVWDLGETPLAQARGLLNRLPHVTGQAVGFVIAEPAPILPLGDLWAWIDANFFAAGDFSACLESLRRWCGGAGTECGALDLTLPFIKQPSRWLRDLAHDHVGLVLLERPFFEAAQLWEAQQEIDLLGNILRNLLCAMDAPIAARRLSAVGDEPCELYRQVYSRPPQMFGPESMASQLAVEYEEGEDYMLYKSAENAAELLAKAAPEGRARIVFLAPSVGLAEASPAATAMAELPAILIGETAAELSWQDWQRQLARNVIGSYAAGDLERQRSGKRILVAQRPYWRACALLSLPALFDRLLERLVQTHAALAAAAPQHEQRITQSLLAIDSARKLYLGESSTVATA
ncbi:MAG TPA: hypothetical protein VN999_13020 [Thermoanaerobaculia bacterium]|nr:hypothetical protein [Thermoanaerobaculia bacterium]